MVHTVHATLQLIQPIVNMIYTDLNTVFFISEPFLANITTESSSGNTQDFVASVTLE